MRVLAISDSDSYLKWSAATLATMPASWSKHQVVVRTPITPSDAQILAATSLDAVVLVTGLPGISIPATERAIQARASCDLFLLHSHREISEFARQGAVVAPDLRFGLAQLPFLVRSPGSPHTGRSEVIFAAQAKVPASYHDRCAILQVLAAEPSRAAVVKLRAPRGEQQTHRERHAYPDLWQDLVGRGLVAAGDLRFAAGSMSEGARQCPGFCDGLGHSCFSLNPWIDSRTDFPRTLITAPRRCPDGGRD